MYASPDYYKKTFVGVISADLEVLASKLKSASDKIDIPVSYTHLTLPTSGIV
mgnify:CR=1 FL=1